MITFKFRGICALLATTLLAGNPQVDLHEALQAAREHVQRLETSVPDFICDERIVSENYEHGKLTRQTRAQAILTTLRMPEERPELFKEERADMVINGKHTKRNEISGPFVWHGGPAYGDLHFLFNSDQSAVCLDRRLVGPAKLGEKDVLLIETHASSEVGRNKDCFGLHPDSADKIWLDAATFNVMRIESYNPKTTPIPGAHLSLTVDYQPVVFDGEEYWLPSHFISRLDLENTPQHQIYEAFYTRYRKFGVNTIVRIQPVQ